MASMVCPHCDAEVLPPTLLHHEYRCPRHGDIAALAPAVAFDESGASMLDGRSRVPIWYPAPLPAGWMLSGLRWAQTPRRSVAAVAIGLTGRGLSDGPTDVVIIAEEPGCGLGAAYAGIDAPDPGNGTFDGPADGRIHTGHRATGLWSVPTQQDRVAFVGEADGAWLWIVGWPQTAWAIVADDLRLADGRVDDSFRHYPSGALNPRLAGASTGSV